MEQKISYTEAVDMCWEEIMEANAALDLYIEAIEAARRKGGAK